MALILCQYDKRKSGKVITKFSSQFSSKNKPLLKKNFSSVKEMRCDVNTRRLQNMNNDCLLQIFDDLDVPDLASLSQLNERFASVADYIVSRHAKSIVYLPTYPIQTYSEIGDVVRVFNYKTFASILHAFGHLIGHIKITYSEMGTPTQTNRILSKYCAKSLKSLELAELTGSDAKTFRTQFEKLEKLTIGKVLSSKSFLSSLSSDLDWNIFRKSMKLNKIFPQLRSLSFSLTEVPHSKMFAVEFPKLEHIQINYLHPMFKHFSAQYLATAAAYTENIFKLNPQVRNLTITNIYTMQCIKMASDLLPNLNHLSLHFLEKTEKVFYFGEKIHFKTVKRLELNIKRKTNLFKSLKFQQLTDLKLICRSEDCIDFPLENTHLRELRIEGFLVENDFFEQLSMKVPNIEELVIADHLRFDAESLFNYIETSERLRKISLITGNKRKNLDWCKDLPEGWQMERSNYVLNFTKTEDLIAN